MGWARVDDNMPDHPKFVRLIDEPDGLAAVGLWVLCLAWARRHHKRGETEALIPHGVPRRLSGCSPSLPSLLVKVGLWTDHADGWLIHDFREYLPSYALSETRAAAGREGGKRSGEVRRLKMGQPGVSPGTESSMLQEESSGFVASEATPKHGGGLGKGSPSTTGSPMAEVGGAGEGDLPARLPREACRLPEDWLPTRELVAWAKKEHPQVDSREETAKFKDHWAASGGQNARKKDWAAAWRNWIRGAGERLGSRPRTTRPDAMDEGFWER